MGNYRKKTNVLLSNILKRLRFCLSPTISATDQKFTGTFFWVEMNDYDLILILISDNISKVLHLVLSHGSCFLLQFFSFYFLFVNPLALGLQSLRMTLAKVKCLYMSFYVNFYNHKLQKKIYLSLTTS